MVVSVFPLSVMVEVAQAGEMLAVEEHMLSLGRKLLVILLRFGFAHERMLIGLGSSAKEKMGRRDMEGLGIKGLASLRDKIPNDVERVASDGSFPPLGVAGVSASCFLFTLSINPRLLWNMDDARFKAVRKNEKSFRPVIDVAEIRGMRPAFKRTG
jgi:hypothetical protein